MIRIHYIEDNLVDQCAFAREIEKKSLPYMVDFSLSLNEARKRNASYDIILCDYFLPDGTILNILPELVKSGTPVVVLTGLAELHNAVSALKLGAKDYLVKDTQRQYLSLLPIQIGNLINNRKIEKDRNWLSTLFTSVVETIPFGVYLYEPDGDRIVYWNTAFAKIWDIPESFCNEKDNLPHSTLSRYLLSQIRCDGTDFPAFLNEKSDDMECQSEGEVRVSERKIIKYFTTLIPLGLDTSNCYVSIFEDISEISRFRESLYQYSLELESINASLDQRVRERTLLIENMLKKKSEMMIHIGHDLRTPLTPLIALLPYLSERESDPEKKRILSILCEGATKIRSLADATLRIGHIDDLTSPENDTTNSISCNLREMLVDIITGYLPVIEEKSLQILNKTPDEISAFMKPPHLHLILDNLIHNAIQYTNPGGSIILHGGVDKDSIWFCVSDSGIGFSPEDASRIFDEFYKVDSARNNLYAHGLGLSVVKKLILLNGGNITVKSDGIGKGSRFCISLPNKDTSLTFAGSSFVSKIF